MKFCNKYNLFLHNSYLCEKCEDNPKVSTGFYNECEKLEEVYETI